MRKVIMEREWTEVTVVLLSVKFEQSFNLCTGFCGLSSYICDSAVYF